MVSCSKLRVMIMSSLMLWSSVVAAQTSAPTKPSEGTLSPQAAATRKTEVQKELKALQETKLPNDRFQRFQAEKRLTAAKDSLGALLTALTGLEKARQRRSNFLKSAEDLPQRGASGPPRAPAPFSPASVFLGWRLALPHSRSSKTLSMVCSSYLRTVSLWAIS